MLVLTPASVVDLSSATAFAYSVSLAIPWISLTRFFIASEKSCGR